MRWFWRYLILCGLAFNIVIAILVTIQITASKSMLQTGMDWALNQIVTDHPRLQFLTLGNESAIPLAPYKTAGIDKGAFKHVKELIDAPGPISSGRILRVGPGRAFAKPNAAAKVARDGDTVLFEPGRYNGGTAIWHASDLILKGDGGMVVLDASGRALPQDKAIWLIQGNRVRIENIIFTGARSRDGNGAGIRAEGTGLHVVNCLFKGNEDGILSNPNPESEIIVEHSEFAYNGHPSGQAHNIYIADSKRLIFRFNYVHHAIIGSNIKSRARENLILYNRIMDYDDGRTNYSIDLSNGGVAYVIGNIIQQGPLTENYHLLTFAPEGAKYPVQELYVVHNTFVNNRVSGQFIRNTSGALAHVYNNIFSGPGGIITGEALLVGNLVERDEGLLARLRRYLDEDDTLGGVQGSTNNHIVSDMGFINPTYYDYHLRQDSPARHAGVKLESVNGVELTPAFEYRHPRSGTPRIPSGLPDVGAYQ